MDFEAHHLSELGRELAVGDLSFRNSEAAQAFEGQIDTALGEINCHVLPEIRKLQGSARAVGKALALFVSIATDVEDDAAHRVGRVAAITEDVIERLVAMYRLVLPKGLEKIGEGLLRNLTGDDGFA
jgi:hypothetical protein